MEIDYIRLFSADLDIKPTLLIEHFLKYMGFYVEKIPFDNHEEDTTAIYDIVVIGNDFVDNKYDLDKIGARAERTILVGTDGYKINSVLGFSICYDSTNEKEFLFQLFNITRTPFKYEAGDINKIINAYIDSGVLESYLFASSWRNCKLFGWAKDKYNNFLNMLPNNTLELIKNINLQSKIELGQIYKINKTQQTYSSSMLLNVCEELLENNGFDVLKIAKGEILYRFRGDWLEGGNTFLSTNIPTLIWVWQIVYLK